MSKKGKINSKQRHAFLLTFFPQTGDFYEEKQVNGFWLVKQYNGGNDSWEVAIYPKESFRKKQQAQELFNPK